MALSAGLISFSGQWAGTLVLVRQQARVVLLALRSSWRGTNLLAVTVLLLSLPRAGAAALLVQLVVTGRMQQRFLVAGLVFTVLAALVAMQTVPTEALARVSAPAAVASGSLAARQAAPVLGARFA